uniref:Uncharacterized protein n=1 Tax=Rhabditophanes sp. KR3021 TaxID=114890 RepID=A0AC35U7E8_9BILA
MAYYKSERLQTRTMTQTTSSSGENFSGNAFNAKNGKITSSNTAERSTIDNTSLFQDSSSKLNRAAALPFIEHGGRILRSSIEKQYIFERKAVSEKQIELSGRSTTKTLLAKKKDVEKLGINPTKVKKSSDTNYKSQTLQPLPNKLVNKRKISSVDGSVNIKQRRIHEVPLIDIKYNTNFNKEIDYSVQNISDASMSFVEEEPTARENNVIAVDDYLAEDLLRNKLNDKLCEEDYAVEQFSDRKVINYCYYYKVKLMGNEKETYVNLLDIVSHQNNIIVVSTF